MCLNDVFLTSVVLKHVGCIKASLVLFIPPKAWKPPRLGVALYSSCFVFRECSKKWRVMIDIDICCILLSYCGDTSQTLDSFDQIPWDICHFHSYPPRKHLKNDRTLSDHNFVWISWKKKKNCRFWSQTSVKKDVRVFEVADVASKWSLSTGPSGCTLHLGFMENPMDDDLGVALIFWKPTHL